MDRLRSAAEELPWLREAADWMFENPPEEPERLAVCHGDFHALNILFDQGAVTGVLDWPGFAIADPAYDVGNTLMLSTIPTKTLAATMGGFSGIDWDYMAEVYLAAYQSKRPFADITNLAYFKARRCLMAIIEGWRGQAIWQHPSIVADLVKAIHEITGVKVERPDIAT